MTIRDIEQLKEFNYVRRAQPKDNYWVDFSKSKLDNLYRRKFGDEFNIIIYSEPETAYYSIPFGDVKHLFAGNSLSKSKSNRQRWIGTISEHSLKFSNQPSFDTSPYYFTAGVVFKLHNEKEQEKVTELYALRTKPELLAELKSLRNFNDVEIEFKGRKLKRDNKAIGLIKLLGDFQCQICKTVIIQRGGKKYIEAAHIHAKSKKGKETFDNILLLCPNHHKEFDFGELVIKKQNQNRIEFVLNGKEYNIPFFC